MQSKISNQYLTATIKHKGAELVSLFNHNNKLEYMWNADPAYWAKTSPVLFPIVGQLKNNTYHFDGSSYVLPRHGFAREMVFSVVEHSVDKIVFQLKSTPDTLKIYPFDFDLQIAYTLGGSSLMVDYIVTNASASTLYFSLGAHPAFAVPLVPQTEYTDYYLEFEKTESAKRWPISKNGTIEKAPEDFLFSTQKLPLRKELFYHDALVFKDLQSSKISLKSDLHDHGLEFVFDGFPYFGIWAFKDADFVCLEPWCGIADSVDHDQQLVNKEGIHVLENGEQWKRSWSVTCF